MNTLFEYITFRRTIAQTVIVALFWIWAIFGFISIFLVSLVMVLATVGVLQFGPIRPEGRISIIVTCFIEIVVMVVLSLLNLMTARITCEFLVHLFRFFENIEAISDSHALVAKQAAFANENGQTQQRYS